MARKKAAKPTPSPRSASGSSTGVAPHACVRKQPVILKEPAKPSARFAEVAGGTAAECAAVVCCCPCGLVNLLVCAVVKLPAGLCRQAIVKRKRKLRIKAKKKAALLGPKVRSTGADEVGKTNRSVVVVTAPATPAPEVVEMEKEMWAKFYGTGFWRSPSQREADR